MVDIILVLEFIHFIIFLACIYTSDYLKFYDNNDKNLYCLVSLIPILNIIILIYSIYLIKKLYK